MVGDLVRKKGKDGRKKVEREERGEGKCRGLVILIRRSEWATSTWKMEQHHLDLGFQERTATGERGCEENRCETISFPASSLFQPSERWRVKKVHGYAVRSCCCLEGSAP